MFHKNGSMLISTDEHGFVSSKDARTFGWMTPILPITLFLSRISAHRPAKYAESKNKNKVAFKNGKRNTNI